MDKTSGYNFLRDLFLINLFWIKFTFQSLILSPLNRKLDLLKIVQSGLALVVFNILREGLLFLKIEMGKWNRPFYYHHIYLEESA